MIERRGRCGQIATQRWHTSRTSSQGGDEVWGNLEDEIGALEGVWGTIQGGWGTLKFDSFELLSHIDETTKVEDVAGDIWHGDEDVIVGVKCKGDMTMTRSKEAGWEISVSLGLKNSKYGNLNSWKSTSQLI